MHGTFVWNELATTDVDAARAFYAATLGWTFEEFTLPQGRYWVARSGDRLVGGIGGLETAALPSTASHWFSFIEVDDVDDCLARAEAHGGVIVQPAEDVPNVGRVAVVRDPTGAAVGWMTSLPQAEEAGE